jgi:hypothetical protein
MQVNQQVSGMYLGEIPFTGTIVESRALTVRTDGCMEFTVRLDKPVTAYGLQREVILMNTKFDGSPSSYTRHTCRMQAA